MAETFDAIHDALVEHQVLFFRDQDISVEAQKAFGALFGELDVHPNDPGLEGHPEVMIIHADETSKRVAGEAWHSDVSCSETPPMGSVLGLQVGISRRASDCVAVSLASAERAIAGIHLELGRFAECDALVGSLIERTRAAHPDGSVHLAAALNSTVGKRANVDVMLEVSPALLAAAGLDVYRAPNGVLLARRVPPACITAIRGITRRARSREHELRARLRAAST